MSATWLYQHVNNPAWLKKGVERTLKDQWIQTWSSNILTKGICSSYNEFKSLYDMEDYLLKLNKNVRVPLTKLRANNNRLPIVTGRYQNISREERVCTKCNLNVIGNEYHIMLVCPNESIADLRNKYVPPYYRNNPTKRKFIMLMQSDDIKTLNSLSFFLRGVFKLFR